MLMPTIALWIAWRLSADYLDTEKRIVGLALLTLIPFFNFHALKFNVNTVLMPVWAATTFWFLRSYTTRGHAYAALAGVGAAACMLGKYWSVFLLVGLIAAALIDRRRATYFRSSAPWITVAAGLIVLAPHLAWLIQYDYAPFSYAVGIHAAKSLAATLKGVLGYLAGSIGYVAVPLIVILAVARPSRATLVDMAWPGDAERRLVATALWAPFLLPAAGALVSSTEITSLWSMPAWTLLPVLLLSEPSVTISGVDTRRILIAAVAVPLIMLLATPAIAVMVQRAVPASAAAHARLLSTEIERAWHEVTLEPLRFVDGDADIVYGVITYARERPRALPRMLRPNDARLAQSGMALVCFAEDADCRRTVAARTASFANSRTIEIEIVRNYLMLPGKAQRYTIMIVPPRP